MIFLTPLMLGLLSLSLLMTFLYFLRRRAQLRTVSALFLWRASTERPRSALSMLWSKIGLLLIQLLALALIILGLARPVLTSAALGGGKIAVIVDGSASMQTRYAINETRYSQAIQQARNYIGKTRPAQLTVIQAHSQSKLLVTMTGNIDEAMQRLAQSEPTLQGDANTRDLIEVLRSQADLKEYREIAIFSDKFLADPLWKSLPVRAVALGKPVQNVAVTGFAVRLEPNRTLGYSIWTEVTNFSESNATIQLSVRADDELIHTEILALSAQERQSFSFDYQNSQKTRFEVEAKLLNGQDAFVFDNRRYFALAERVTIKVIWIGEENIFLERALLAKARLQIAKIQALTSLNQLNEADLIVANNASLPTIAEGRWLLINSSSEKLIETKEAEPAQNLRVTQSDHPLLQLFEPNHVRLTKVQRVVLPKEGKPILMSGDNPAVYVLNKTEAEKELKVIGLGFNLQESNLVLTVDFPILVRNALGWLLPQIEPTVPKQVGQALKLAGFSGEGVEVLTPQGQRIALDKEQNLVQTETPGFFLLKTAENTRAWAVNLALSESEVGSEGRQEPSAQSQQGQVQVQAQFPLWRFLLIAALLALIGELFVYDRAWFRPTRGGAA